MAKGIHSSGVEEDTVRRLWWAALETLQADILLPMDPMQGLWIAAPLPALYEPRLLERLKGWVWAPEELTSLHSPNGNLLLPKRSNSISKYNLPGESHYRRMPLREDDGYDPLLIIITPQIQIALSLYGSNGKRHLLMRSDPEVIADLLKIFQTVSPS